jgi:hypothetical protein
VTIPAVPDQTFGFADDIVELKYGVKSETAERPNVQKDRKKGRMHARF